MTLAELQARLASYLAAEQRILQSQEYVVGNGGMARRNRRAELEPVQTAIRELQGQIAAAEAAQNGRRRVLYIR